MVGLTADQRYAAHILGKLVLDDADKVVLAGRRRGVGAIAEVRRAAEADVARRYRRSQAERLRLGRSHGQVARQRRGSRQRRGARRALGLKHAHDRAITLACVAEYLALTEIASSQGRSVYFAVADVSVDGNRIGEKTIKVAGDIIDRRDKPARQPCGVLIERNVDFHRGISRLSLTSARRNRINRARAGRTGFTNGAF